ncbi:ubiquitin carboxyl-terminal hydrolase 8-like isoform X1 [Primulina huaijiensis]|uniref:ubiquitin carboxyl-terminal hydrolase 8-like isoform X1 n=3 Tax=Primulina huaijiensis TaxID=1492673 RepID=UPI003CC73358
MNRRPPQPQSIISSVWAITKPLNLNFPSLFRLCRKSERFVVRLLRRLFSRVYRSMDSIIFSYSPQQDDDFFSNSFDNSHQSQGFLDSVESLFLVSFSWWKEAVCDGGIDGESSGIPHGVLYNATVHLNGAGEEDEQGEEMEGFGESEITVDMRREGEAGIRYEDGISGNDGDFAMLSEWMFLRALKWHFDVKYVENLLHGENSEHDWFSIQIRLLHALGTNLLVVKINQKDNKVGSFNRACNIFCSKSDLLRVWDFSGQTNHLFWNDENLFMESSQSKNEILMELQIYGLSYAIKDGETIKEEMVVEQSMIVEPYSYASVHMNGSVDKMNLYPSVKPTISFHSGFGGTCALGLTGLCNLGNTCFMNSAIQCLVHTSKLVDYFLGDFRRDLNFENPLGLSGKLAIAFGDLLRKLWAPGSTPVAPRMFKSTLSSFAPQFSGYNQHDAQEFLAFLLDGLHEDLNRVKNKPYIQAKDDDGRPVEEVANEYWANHLSRNDSIIVDLCQGQYRSTLVCPVCKKMSITFDPFMYLSLPLPSTTVRAMTLTVLSTNGTALPHPVTITVPNNGTFKDLVEALGTACSLRDDERLLVAEIFNNCIFRILEDPNDSIELIRDHDQLVAYILPKVIDGSPLVEFIHQREEKSIFQSYSNLRKFGVPLLARMSDVSKGSEMHKEFLKLINPFLMSVENFLNDCEASRSSHEDKVMRDAVSDEVVNSDVESENNLNFCSDFEFYVDSGTFNSRSFKIEMDMPVPVLNPCNRIKVIVMWPGKMIESYDTAALSALPEVCKQAFLSKRPQDSISLYTCVEAFLKEEPLGPEDMWYCPDCKDHRQANKKLDLWRSPEILVIHLKRFSFNRIFKNKLETFVDFPISDFDLSNYVFDKNGMASCRYILYAVSNHYGGMGGGHYTAFVKNGSNRWYEFDDTHVSPVTNEAIKTQAAYVLFYKRI